MPATIRPARATDVETFVLIENTVFQTDRMTRRSFLRLMKSPTAVMFAAEIGEHIAGYCVLLFRAGSRKARLYSIASYPCEGVAGIGRSLLHAAERAALAHGRHILKLEVRENNSRAISLYEKNGYRRIGMEPNYYADGSPALRYEKRLDGADRDGATAGNHRISASA